MREKVVSVVGVGALGSTVAMNMAKVGVKELRLLDHDTVETGNLSRWEPALDKVGQPKTEALQSLIENNYPYVHVRPMNVRVGQPDASLEQSIESFLAGSDIIIDASCDLAVNDYLAAFCSENETPYIWVSGTHGGWGGIVGRVLPEKGKGCFNCYRWKRYNQEIANPPADPSGDIQPVGCFHPTFPGAAFDMDQPALMAARLATATLCHNTHNGYPDFDWDVGVLRAWDDANDRPTAPQWDTHVLSPSGNCRCQGS